MKNSDLKKKKKKKKEGLKMHIKTKENISKHAKKLSFHFFHIYKKENGVEMRFETNTNFDNAV